MGPGVATELRGRAWDAFAETAWHEPRPEPIAQARKNVAPSYAEVFGSDAYHREKKESDPNLYALAPAVATLAVDVCELCTAAVRPDTDTHRHAHAQTRTRTDLKYSSPVVGLHFLVVILCWRQAGPLRV